VSKDWILEDRSFYYYHETTAYEPVDPVMIDVLRMRPNPATGYVQLDLQENASLHLFNSTGQLIRQLETSSGNHVLDVSGLPAGPIM